MKVGHVTATYPPQRTGTGNVAYHNTRELVRRGHDVHALAPRTTDTTPYEILEQVHVHRLQPALRYGNAAVLPSLFTRLQGFDIIHLHMPFYGGAEPVALLQRLKHIPLVITHHQDVKLKGATALISRILDRLVSTSLMCRADRACFTSLDYAHTSQYAPLIHKQKIRLAELPNGVDVEQFAPSHVPEQLQQRYRADEHKLVLFVGVLDRAHYFKGVNHLLHVCANGLPSDTALLIVGKGNMLPEYQHEAQRLGIADRVHFAGFVPDDELADYYRLADVTVLPSTTAGEAFGLVLVESLACGTPVVASSLPGVRTVVADGEDGFLIQPGDTDDLAAKLTTVLTLPAERRRAMGEAGQRKVEARYAWGRIGDILETLYQEVLHERQHPPG